MRRAGITASARDPKGGRYLRDAHGKPTGIVQETAVDLLWYSFFATNDANVKLGGNPFGNRFRFYRGSDNDFRLNWRVQRFRADPGALADCAALAEAYGYDEVNLNVGCPSDRVQSARFGACLMGAPDLVARCVAAMRAAPDPAEFAYRLGMRVLGATAAPEPAPPSPARPALPESLSRSPSAEGPSAGGWRPKPLSEIVGGR